MLQKEFDKFDKLIKIESETQELIAKRDMLKKDFKSKFPDLCKQKGIELNSNEIRFIMQGSFKLGTTIKSVDGDVDLDQAVIFPLDINEFEDSRVIKKLGKNALEISGRRIPKIKEPCVTVDYIRNGEDWLHVDFPMYADSNGLKYLARGKENSSTYSWELADPDGLNEYILNRLSSSENGQLRRIVRFIKKWKQESYTKTDTTEKKPPNIGLTLFVVDLCVESNSDLVSLKNLFQSILNQFTIQKDIDGNVIKASIRKQLPVLPYSNVFVKFDNSENHGIVFYNKLNNALTNLQNACDCDNEHDAAYYVSKVLGNDFEIPEKDVEKYETKVQREHSFG